MRDPTGHYVADDDWLQNAIDAAEDDENEDACPMCDGDGVFWIINSETDTVRVEECGDCGGTGLVSRR